MKEIHNEYNELAKKLAELDGPENRLKFEREQKRRLEAFRNELKVEASEEAKEIDWAEIESKVFSSENLDQHLTANPEGYGLYYDAEGQPGLGQTYNGGSHFIPFAYDKTDAERYVKRQKRKQLVTKRK